MFAAAVANSVVVKPGDACNASRVASWLDSALYSTRNDVTNVYYVPVEDDGDIETFGMKVDGERMLLMIYAFDRYRIEWRWCDIEHLSGEERPYIGPRPQGECGHISTSGYTRAVDCHTIEEVVTLLQRSALRETRSYTIQPGYSDFGLDDLFG